MRVVVLGVVLLGLVGVAAADTTCPQPPCAGNVWHLPASMRTPVRAVSGQPVVIVSGNQFAGAGGNPGNQMQTGSRVMYRLAGAIAWSEAPLTYLETAGNDKRYTATLPAIAAGGEVEYYLRIAYSDHPTTFVRGGDDASATTLDEAVAQSRPFRYVAERPLAPEGAPTTTDGVDVYPSGHVGFSGVVIAPPLVKVDGSWRQPTPTWTFEATHDGVVRAAVAWPGLAVEAVEVQAASPGDEHFFGLGEKFDRLDQAGKVARVLAVDAPGAKGDRSYKVVPWFVSTRGYGVHLASTVESSFDLRAGRDDRWVITAPTGALALDLIAGPTIADALTRFTAITGRPPSPPSWAFAPWVSSDHWRDGGEVRYVVTRYRELGLPGSVFVFDSPWEVAYNDLTWNTEQFARGGTYGGAAWDGFATPGEMLAFLDAHGFKVVVWMTPFVNVSSNDEGVPGQELGRASIYDEAAAAGYFVRSSPGGAPLLVDWWKGRGSPIDFTNPDARAWFQGRLTALVAASGGVIAGFKTDDGESDFIPATASYFDGRTGAEMKNGYSVAYHGAVYEVLGADGVLWSRSGFTGTQAFPGHWAGDNEPNFGADNGLPSVVVAGLSAAMSGWSIWGHDIGGYQEGNPSSTPEALFMRWAQFGALSPIMQIHRQVGGDHQYPWSYGDEALDVYRAYAQLHTDLFPYLYAYVDEAARTGLPILRPLALTYPDDVNTYAVSHTYTFGEHLLVAPVITNQDPVRQVYLPAGTWFDWFTGEELSGGRTIAWQSDDPMRMPLFVRGGAIVPRLAAEVATLIDVPDELDVLVYPDATTSFTLADGTALTSTVSDDRTTFAIDGAPRAITARVRFPDEPVAVRVDDLDAAWTRDGDFVVVALAPGATELALWRVPPPVDPADPDAGPWDGGAAAPGGCGCDSGGDGAGLLVLALGGLALLGRIPHRLNLIRKSTIARCLRV